MKVAFYASMKPPDDPVPSGDRTMARQLFKALEMAGHEVELLSRMKCRVRSSEHLDEVRADADHEVARIAALWRAEGAPDAVVTYHVYYRSPDLVGAELAKQFGIAYITVEASHAGKRSTGEWAAAQALSDAAIAQAVLNICFTARDREGIASIALPERIALLAPFADLDGFDVPPARTGDGPVELITVAMMLKGAKMESWRLLLVGDGPLRGEVERLFTGVEAVRFAGQVDRRAVAGLLARSDVFVWPGWREAFGLAYLEAQAMGLPVVAMESGGVADVVRDGKTGMLSPQGDAAALAAAMERLIGDAALRRQMGEQAMQFVRGERNLPLASAALDALIRRAVA
jgi:glycosyltransferase involved in cell wall biosynthesis